MRKTVMTLMTTMAGAGFAIAGLLPGTAHAQQGADPSSQRAAPAAAVEAMGEVKTATATVIAIDKEKRTVTLKGEDGKHKTVAVSEDVQAFDQVKKGDKIRMSYQESAALDIYMPGEARPAATEREETSRTAGSSPSGMTVREQTISAEIISVDPKKNIVKVKGPEGKAKEIPVQNPEVRQKLKDLKPGMVVQIRYKEAMAVTLEPQK
jgi:hypothetical protein